MIRDEKLSHCPLETAVLSALATASLSGDTLLHAQACSACRETVAVWSYLNTVAAAEADPPLPSPDLIWWKAQLAHQRRIAARSVTVINLFQKFALAAGVLAIFFCAFSVRPLLSSQVPALYLWAALSLVAISLLTAGSFFLTSRHTTRR